MSISGNQKTHSKFRALLAGGLLLTTFGTTACSGINLSDSIFPGPIFASNFPPPGPENYQSGMKDGCETAIHAISASTLYGSMQNGFVVNANLVIDDPVYYKAWKDGFAYCKHEHSYYQG